MGKVKQKKDKKSKMADLVTERRTSTNLKRSRSVRASLRLIGTKLLHPGKNYSDNQRKIEAIQKSTSLSNLEETRREIKKNYLQSESEFQPSSLFTPETILKTPINNTKDKKARKKEQRQYLEYHFPAPQPSKIPPKARKCYRYRRKKISSLRVLDTSTCRRAVFTGSLTVSPILIIIRVSREQGK
ncbi:hypothetical protein WA026_001463 [Henosepilachna vigintioctopunctata]|uniref:Uncharacterized protein n=1 Tax=Henosepilachna vigintioctopunctata TaxID=420089 RepID=A0AAW1UJR9_9CUCU